MLIIGSIYQTELQLRFRGIGWEGGGGEAGGSTNKTQREWKRETHMQQHQFVILFRGVGVFKEAQAESGVLTERDSLVCVCCCVTRYYEEALRPMCGACGGHNVPPTSSIP